MDISKFSHLSLMFSAVLGQLGNKKNIFYCFTFKDGGDVNDVYRYLGGVFFYCVEHI